MLSTLLDINKPNLKIEGIASQEDTDFKLSWSIQVLFNHPPLCSYSYVGLQELLLLVNKHRHKYLCTKGIISLG
jgi:hypothetical protein